MRADIGLWGRALWGQPVPLSFSIHTQGWGLLGGRVLRLTLLGIWPAGIWSNIFSLNLLDAWYDLTSSDDTWKQHIRDKIRDLGKEPGVRLLPLLMLQGRDGSTVRIRQGQAFPSPSLDQHLFLWAQRCPLPPRGPPHGQRPCGCSPEQHWPRCLKAS